MPNHTILNFFENTPLNRGEPHWGPPEHPRHDPISRLLGLIILWTNKQTDMQTLYLLNLFAVYLDNHEQLIWVPFSQRHIMYDLII
jgi:hypothetical protein